MNQLIDELLDFSRINRKTIQNQQVDMDAIVKTVIESFAPETANRQIDWSISPLKPARGDSTLLQQVSPT